MDAKGNCVSCDSPSFLIGWYYGSYKPAVQQELYEKCINCAKMTPNLDNYRSCYNYTKDVSDATIKVYNSDCIQYWKGRRYVSANYKCALCPPKDSDAWTNTLDDTQREQCTPAE